MDYIESEKSSWEGKLLIAISILIIPFIYIKSVLDPALMPRFVGLSICVLLFLFIILSNNKKYNLSILKRWIFPLYLGYIIISGLSIFSSTNTSESIIVWLKIFTICVHFVLVVVIFSNRDDYLILLSKTIILFSIICIIIGLFQFYKTIRVSSFDHQSAYKITATFAHKNLFSQVLFFSLPFSLYGAYILKKSWKYISILTSLLLFFLIFILLTKSVWLALIIAFIIFIITFLFKFLKQKKLLIKISLGIAISLSIIIISGLLYSKFDSIETLKKQTDWLQNYKFGSSLERIYLWERSIEMLKEKPLFGVGVGNWKILVSKYGHEGLRSESGTIHFQRPHNDYIWVLSETGIIGFILYFSITIVILFYVFKIIKSLESIEEITFYLLMLSAMAGIIIISLLSFPMERIEHSIFINLIYSSIVIKYHQIKPLKMFFSKKLLIFCAVPIIILILFSLAAGILRVKSEYHTQKAFKHRANKNWNGVIREIDKAYSNFSTLDPAATPLLWYRGSSYYNLGNTNNAYLDFEESYQTHPYHIHVLNNLATCYEIKGDHQNAEIYYKKALKISPTFEDAVLNLCAIYYNSERIDEAYDIIGQCDSLTYNPKYQTFLLAILRKKIDNLLLKIDDRLLRSPIQRIINVDEWMLKTYKQAILNKISYEKQILRESIFVLEAMDHSIDDDEVQMYKSKYNLD